MKKQVIALDIDDTLFDHFADIVVWYNARFGTSLTLENNHPRVHDELAEWNVKSIEEAVRRVHAFYETPQFTEALPYKDALRVLPRLARHYDIVVVTARDIDILEQFTHQWLRQHLAGHYREVHFTGQYNLSGKSRTKREVLEVIGAAYLIDDSLDNCMEAASAGVTGLLFGAYPWNRADQLPSSIVRVRDWNAVEAFFALHMPQLDFHQSVYDVVARIPLGRVMTYGDIAAYAGHPYAARQVGGLAHFGPVDLPWHRVVNRFGDCASGYYGGKEGHRHALEAEGFQVVDYRITDFATRRWRPE